MLRTGAWRRAALTGVIGLVMAGLMPLDTEARAASATEETSLSEGQQALARAEETGERVEVVGERSEYSTVFANPDGETFTLNTSIVPVRVEQPDGGWVEPDPTLVRQADGSIVPKAAAVGIELSAGG